MKYKWLYLTVELEMNQIIQQLSMAKFTIENKFGFEVIDYYNEMIEFSYFEQINISDTYELPDGNKVYNSYIKVTEFDFKIIKSIHSKYILQISKPPRSLKNFINNLECSLKKEIFISSMEININNLISYLSNSKEITSIKISRLSVYNVKLDGFNFIDIILKSNKSPLLLLEERFGKQMFIFKQIECSLFYNEQELCLKVTNNGASDMNLELQEVFINFLSSQVC